jgi:hypothetical protein
MGAIVIQTRYDEGTESAEVATSGIFIGESYSERIRKLSGVLQNENKDTFRCVWKVNTI